MGTLADAAPTMVENRPGTDGALGAEAFAYLRSGEAVFFRFPGGWNRAAPEAPQCPNWLNSPGARLQFS